MYRFFAISGIFLFVFASCKDNRTEYGFVRLKFQHQWNGEPIRIDDQTEYTNRAGNTLRFTKLQYIISDLMILGADNIRVEHPGVYFIDRDTTVLILYQIPVGMYNSIGFTFGLDERKNITGLFPNLGPPMAWPVGMGGGYHHLMFDGHWACDIIATSGSFRLHLGSLERIIRYDTIPHTGEIIPIWHRFHNNHFYVSLPRTFEVRANQITTVPIIMDVEQWMESPQIWDVSVMNPPGNTCTMSREKALDSLRINGEGARHGGRNVFR